MGDLTASTLFCSEEDGVRQGEGEEVGKGEREKSWDEGQTREGGEIEREGDGRGR